MIYKVITKKEFKKFINGLIKENPTFGPVKVDTNSKGEPIYQLHQVYSFDEMDLEYTRIHSSIKNFFLPYRETLSSFEFSENDWQQKIEYRTHPRVIVGARACDINGLNILDRIIQGYGEPEDIDRLIELGETIKSTALCGMGTTAPNPVLSSIQYFREEWQAHIVE